MWIIISEMTFFSETYLATVTSLEISGKVICHCPGPTYACLIEFFRICKFSTDPVVTFLVAALLSEFSIICFVLALLQFRWAGSWGIKADFVAKTKCSLISISSQDLKVQIVFTIVLVIVPVLSDS